MEIVGHRGAAALGPENTLDAIRAGLAAGAAGVEVDVRMTADGVLILMHDPDVGATTDGTGRVADLPSALLEALTPAVPTVDEVLEAVPREALLILELKGHPWEAGYDPAEPVAHALARRLAGVEERRIVVSSFNPMALRVIRERAAGIRTGILTSEAFDLATNLAAAVDGEHDECHVPIALLEAAFVDQAHAAGKRVLAWTVNDPDDIRACASMGVDAIITDDPRAAAAALAG